ncbi:MAG: hypothetical protein AB1486_24730 [Planctomycetota bacterium]
MLAMIRLVLSVLLGSQQLPSQPPDVPLLPVEISVHLGPGDVMTLAYNTLGYSAELVEAMRRQQGPQRIAGEGLLSFRWGARLRTPVPLRLGGHAVPAGEHQLRLWFGEGGGLELVVLDGRERAVLEARCHRAPVEAKSIICGISATRPGGLELSIQFGSVLGVVSVDVVRENPEK